MNVHITVKETRQGGKRNGRILEDSPGKKCRGRYQVGRLAGIVRA